MIKSITYFHPHKTALTVSLVFAVSSLIFLIPLGVISSFAPAPQGNGATFNQGFPALMLFVMPIFYFVFGYIFTALSCWLYNVISGFTGGIKIDITD